MTVDEVVANVLAGEHGDFVREAVRLVAHELMEAEISQENDAAHGEVSAELLTHRNGKRLRQRRPRSGAPTASAEKALRGGLLPLLPGATPAQRAGDRGGCAEGLRTGVSTHKVGRLFEQLGTQGMSKDRVSALCRALDEQVEAFRQRPLEGDWVPRSGHRGTRSSYPSGHAGRTTVSCGARAPVLTDRES
jgi:putative transposase